MKKLFSDVARLKSDQQHCVVDSVAVTHVFPGHSRDVNFGLCHMTLKVSTPPHYGDKENYWKIKTCACVKGYG